MKRNLLFLIMLLFLGTFSSSYLYSQSEKEQKEFNLALREYVAQKIAAHGNYLVNQEKFLLSLISLTNAEMRERVGDVVEARKKFLESLDQDKKQLLEIKTRLHNQGKHDLDVFILELERKIQNAIDSKAIDFKQKRVFEDGIQLLQVAEGMSGTGSSISQENANLQYQQTRKKLEKTFDRVGVRSGDSRIIEEATLYDLYKEWMMLKLTNYQAKYLKVTYYRKKLINKSNLSDIRKMAASQIEVAYQIFNYGDYDLAASLLEDAYDTYSEFLTDFSDVLYYAGEAAIGAGQYPRGEKWFNLCIEKFPNTQYHILSLVRVIQLDILFEKHNEAYRRFSEYIDIAPASDPNRETMILTIAISKFNIGRYDETVRLLSEISSESENYFLAQYLLSKGYAASENYPQAKQILSKLILNKDVSPELFQRALLRFSLILYEEENFTKAINILLKIDESFSQFDLVINALAWAEYKYQLTLPVDQQNFRVSLDYIDMLLNEYYGSVYALEVKTLKAYILQITNNPTAAKSQYQEVYTAKKYKQLNDSYLDERFKLKGLIEKSKNYEGKALVKNDISLYGKIKNTRYKIEDQYNFYEMSELSAHGTRLYSEISKVLRQLKEIEKLRGIATQKGDGVLVKRLDNLELRLKANLERIALPKNMANRPYNFFELNPTAKQVSESEYKNQKILESRETIKNDIVRVKEQLALVNKNIEKTKFTGEKEKLPKLIRRKAMFEELLHKYQELLSYAYAVKVKPVYDELNMWADYGGFGMINVNFEMRQDAQNALKYNANIVSQIEEVFRNKKRGIENKIRLIEAAVKTMTMRAREEERNRVRAERERTFKEGYFDTRSSEFEPILPEIQLEGQSTKENEVPETEEQKNNDQ